MEYGRRLTSRRTVQQTIDPNESAYIARKTVTSLDVWTSYLHAVNLTGLVVSDFVPAPADAVAGQTVPNVGFAVSGGGIRCVFELIVMTIIGA